MVCGCDSKFVVMADFESPTDLKFNRVTTRAQQTTGSASRSGERVALPPVRDMRRFPRPTCCANSTAHSRQNGPTEWAYSPTVKPPQQESSRRRVERTAHSY